jgi:hypothetical protein
LPRETVKKHLRRLDEAGWIDNAGRGHTRRGAPRRTATLKITKQTIDHIEPYGFLPWWACCEIQKVGRLPWCARAVLSVWMARLCGLKSAVDAQQDAVTDEEYAGAIDNLGDDRFRFSLNWLAQQTGLTRDSVVTAKRFLNHRYGIGLETSPRRGSRRRVIFFCRTGHSALWSHLHPRGMSISRLTGGRKVGNRGSKSGQYPSRKLGNTGVENWVRGGRKLGIAMVFNVLSLSVLSIRS